MTGDYRDAWLESLPADMGNVNVSEHALAASDGSEPQQQLLDDQVGACHPLLPSSSTARPLEALAALDNRDIGSSLFLL